MNLADRLYKFIYRKFKSWKNESMVIEISIVVIYLLRVRLSGKRHNSWLGLACLSALKVSPPCFWDAALLGLPLPPAAASWSLCGAPISVLPVGSSGFCPALFISHFTLSHPPYPFPLPPLILVTFTYSPATLLQSRSIYTTAYYSFPC